MRNIETADNDVRYVPIEGHLSACGLGHEVWYNWVKTNWDLKNKVVLDFGCGSGYGAYMISKVAKEVHAVDISPKAIEFAKEKYSSDNINFYACDTTSEEIFDILTKKTYDIILSTEVIEHIEKYFIYLENVCKLLKEDGTFILGTPNRLQLFNWQRKWNPFHFQEFSPYQMRKILSLYFDDVTLVGKIFKDKKKEEAIRSSVYGGKLRPFKELIRNMLPEGAVNIIKSIKKPAGGIDSSFKYSDIEFKIEPGEEVLNKQNSVNAICKKVNSSFNH